VSVIQDRLVSPGRQARASARCRFFLDNANFEVGTVSDIVSFEIHERRNI
jgi:hypothetical protein